MPERIYKPTPALDVSTIESALEKDDPEALLTVVLSAALHSDDRDFAEDVCVRLADHSHFNVRGNALLGFAHIARIDRELTETIVRPLILKGLEDENEYVQGQALDA